MHTDQIKDKTHNIFEKFFKSSDVYLVKGDEEFIPLLAANLKRSTPSFTEGQLLYIYDDWGMAENLKVVARYRAKHRFVDSHCAIHNVTNFRPKQIHSPVVIKKLKGQVISKALFKDFFNPDRLHAVKVYD